MPDKRIVRATVKALRSLPGWPGFRAIDLSCGEGRVLEALAAAGCRAEGTHFRSDDYICKRPSDVLRTAVIHDGIDLSKPLPFGDGTYDVVLATEVVEHLPSHSGLFAEAARILKPGGWFVFSTPNIHRVQSRLQFLLSGQHELRSARLGWDVPAGELYTTHHNPVYFPVVHTLLHQQGLRVARLVFTMAKPWAWLLLPLYPLLCLGAAIETRHAFRRSREGGRDLLRWMVDPRLVFSDQLMVVAHKREQRHG